jgi:hypothetical protein
VGTSRSAYLVIVAALLHSDIKDFLWTHPWWHSFLVAVPAIALPILAYFELRHSGEANALRNEANILRRRNADLAADLDSERNAHLQQIARNTQRAVTQAERNAATLRRHLRARVVVSEGQNNWGPTPEILEVTDDNMVTLFTPRGHTSSSASCVRVSCDELEIAEIPQGSCPLRLKILRRYGPDIQLGEITRWEDRSQPAATPSFDRGGSPYWATYRREGSSETRGTSRLCLQGWSEFIPASGIHGRNCRGRQRRDFEAVFSLAGSLRGGRLYSRQFQRWRKPTPTFYSLTSFEIPFSGPSR